MNYEGFCRTAPATPGLLEKLYFIISSKSLVLLRKCQKRCGLCNEVELEQGGYVINAVATLRSIPQASVVRTVIFCLSAGDTTETFSWVANWIKITSKYI